MKKDNFSYYFANIYGTAIFLFVVYLLFGPLYGQRMVDDHIAENLKYIWNHPSLSTDQKWAYKLGFDFKYLNQIENRTPREAVIWMPPDSIVAPENGKTPFNTGKIGITSKAWAIYFLYPRTLVYDTARASAIDYVAIANGKGYERLPYRINKKTQHTILPMRKNQTLK